MRPIDADEVKKRFPIMENDFGMVINETLHKELDKIPPLEVIPKDQYEARLKADMVAMLVRLNNEVDDLRAYDDIETVDKCEEIIQQKINALKGEV